MCGVLVGGDHTEGGTVTLKKRVVDPLVYPKFLYRYGIFIVRISMYVKNNLNQILCGFRGSCVKPEV